MPSAIRHTPPLPTPAPGGRAPRPPGTRRPSPSVVGALNFNLNLDNQTGPAEREGTKGRAAGASETPSPARNNQDENKRK